MFNSNYSDQINNAANIIDAGGVVIIPTDTLYGLAVSALIPNAIDKVFKIKKRPKTQPLPILIPDNDYLYEYTKNIPELAFKITQKFWPGPLTVILEKNAKIPNNLTAGSKYVAIRIPDEEIVRSICRNSRACATCCRAVRSIWSTRNCFPVISDSSAGRCPSNSEFGVHQNRNITPKYLSATARWDVNLATGNMFVVSRLPCIRINPAR